MTARYVPDDATDAEDAAVCVAPRMLKLVVGKKPLRVLVGAPAGRAGVLAAPARPHPARRARGGARLGGGGGSFPPVSSLFSFELEDRIAADGMCCYKSVKGCTQLLLPIPLEAATNRAEVDAYESRAKRRKLEAGGGPAGAEPEEEPVVPVVPFDACLAKLMADQPLESFRNRRGASKATRLATFPKYLVFQLAKYYTTETWEAKKLAVSVPMPQALDLTLPPRGRRRARASSRGRRAAARRGGSRRRRRRRRRRWRRRDRAR